MEKKEKKWLKRMRRRARFRRVFHFFLVMYYTTKYQRKYALNKPTKKEAYRELNKPWKVMGFVRALVQYREGEHVDELKRLLSGDTVTDKTVILFMNQMLQANGYRVYTFWIGYRAHGILPLSAVIERDMTITMHPDAYKIHIGDQFDIMRDHIPNANRWIILDPEMENLIMSYSEGRSKWGGVDIAVYDDEYWGEQRPFAHEVVKNLKLKPISQRGEVP